MANVPSIAAELLDRVVGLEKKIERFLTDQKTPGAIDSLEARELSEDIDDLQLYADANLSGQELIQKSTRGTDPTSLKRAAQRHMANVALLG